MFNEKQIQKNESNIIKLLLSNIKIVCTIVTMIFAGVFSFAVFYTNTNNVNKQLPIIQKQLTDLTIKVDYLTVIVNSKNQITKN